jgi:hypothetical protein
VKRVLVALLATALRRCTRGVVPVMQPIANEAQEILTSCFISGEPEMTHIFLRMNFNARESAAALVTLKRGVSVAEGAHV